jgi:hypothetical protein
MGYSKIFLFSMLFGYICHARTFILRQAHPSTKIIWMVSTHMITWVYTNSLTLSYFPKSNIWLVLQLWYPHVGSLLPLLAWPIGTMHPPIYRSNIVHTCVYNPTHTDQHICFPLLNNLKWLPFHFPWTPIINLRKETIRDAHYHVHATKVDGAQTNT